VALPRVPERLLLHHVCGRPAQHSLGSLSSHGAGAGSGTALRPSNHPWHIRAPAQVVKYPICTAQLTRLSTAPSSIVRSPPPDSPPHPTYAGRTAFTLLQPTLFNCIWDNMDGIPYAKKEGRSSMAAVAAGDNVIN
jgi:hypothetical protein